MIAIIAFVLLYIVMAGIMYMMVSADDHSPRVSAICGIFWPMICLGLAIGVFAVPLYLILKGLFVNRS